MMGHGVSKIDGKRYEKRIDTVKTKKTCESMTGPYSAVLRGHRRTIMALWHFAVIK